VHNTVEHLPNHLFYASLENGVVNNPRCDFVLDMGQNTNTINVTTEGLSNPQNKYSLIIEDDNGDYTFFNTLASSTQLRYITACSSGKLGQPEGRLRTLTLNESHPTPRIILRDDTRDKEVYSANLIELILELRKQGVTVDFDDIHVYDIHFKFSGTGMDVEVSINGWIVSGSNSEL
jgi:hypothetical protein